MLVSAYSRFSRLFKQKKQISSFPDEEERAQAQEPGLTEAMEVERAAANPAPEYGDNDGLPPYEP